MEAIALAQGPKGQPYQEEASRMYESRRRSDLPVSPDPHSKRLRGATYHGECGHGGAEDRHEEDRGANLAAGDEIVVGIAAEHPSAEVAKR